MGSNPFATLTTAGEADPGHPSSWPRGSSRSVTQDGTSILSAPSRSKIHRVHMLAYCSVRAGLSSMVLTRAWRSSKCVLFLQGSCTAGWTTVAQIAGGRGSVSVEQAREPIPHRILQRACQVLRQNSSLHKLQAWCVFACRSYNPASCACCNFEPLLVCADAAAVVTRGQRCTVLLSSCSQQVLWCDEVGQFSAADSACKCAVLLTRQFLYCVLLLLWRQLLASSPLCHCCRCSL